MRFSAATTAGRFLPERLANRLRTAGRTLSVVLLSRDAHATAQRMSLIAFAIRVLNAAIAFVSQVLLANWMGGFEYGIFVLVWTAMVIAGNISCFGFHTSVIRFIPEFRETGRLDALRGVLITSRLFVLLASTVIALGAMVAMKMLAGSIEPYYVVPFILGFFCLPMIALSDLLQGMSRAHAWPVAALAPTYITRPVLILALMPAAIWLGYPPTANTAVVVAIVATYATTLAQLATVTARIDRKIPRGPRFVDLRGWIAISLPIFLVESFFFILTNADVLMVGAYMRPDDVAVYFATVKTLALVHFVYFAVKTGVAQRYASITHGASSDLAAFARSTVSWTFWPSVLMALVVLALGEPILALFGPGFSDGYPLLFPLVAGVVARAAVGPCESLLTMSGHQNVCAAVYAMTLALNIALNVVLIPVLGLWGAAIATALSMGFEAAALSFTVWRKLGIAMVIFAPRPSTGVPL